MNRKIEKIFTLLKKNLVNSCAKYSHFRVSAAIETREGELFFGVNVESDSFGLSMCAEQTALGSALSGGERDFASIYICGETDKYIRPCGRCRQLLSDYCKDLDVYMFSENGSYQKMKIEDLLPLQFDL
ncbi:MAG: cytidine deaminase [Candidatus Delongbacteria bacterium]|nr:MAG: cytidine deaminase [Candidatus Delongbacteria bacterium]